MQNKFDDSAYMIELSSKSEYYQVNIEQLLEKYKAQPVGIGYIDLILSVDTAIKFIDEITGLGVAIESLSWWCHCTPDSMKRLGCPHGNGGPKNKFGEGSFSECGQFPFFEVLNYKVMLAENVDVHSFVRRANEITIDYIKNILPTESFYSPCLYPGLWLYVPNKWKRLNYFV